MFLKGPEAKESMGIALREIYDVNKPNTTLYWQAMLSTKETPHGVIVNTDTPGGYQLMNLMIDKMDEPQSYTRIY